ncbi:MAG: DUF3592 domain-containing protein [Gammaproteobacteria bacterium]|nr:DUF3592 domain-containing protein [Gammaproteobacteria bacterium]
MGIQSHYIILSIAIALSAIGIFRLNKYSSLNKWVKLGAIILSIKESWKDVALSPYSIAKYYYPEIEYEYNFNSNSYKSKAVSFNLQNIWVCEVDDFGIEAKDDDMFWRAWQKGDEISIYVNPQQPSQAVIINELVSQYKSHNLALIISGILIFTLWLYVK